MGVVWVRIGVVPIGYFGWVLFVPTGYGYIN